MKKFTIQTILLLAVITIALVFFGPTGQSGKVDIPFLPQPPIFRQLEINSSKLKVEIADTQAKRSKGLGGRVSLDEDEGMLFIFEKPDKYPFWMKELKFPLDLIYISGDTVVDLITDVPPPVEGVPDESLPIYQPRAEIDKVLEVNAGLARKLNIKIGDKVQISNI